MKNLKINSAPQLLGLILSIAISSDLYAAPVGVPDIVSVQKDTTIVIDVLANDEGTGLTVVEPSPFTNQGASVALIDNQLSYTPPAGFVGEDKIFYVLTDSEGLENFSEVIITVSEDANATPGETEETTEVVDEEVTDTDPVSTGPLQANPDAVSTVKNTTIVIPVLANDGGSGLTLVEPSAFSQQGGDVVMIDNQLSYMPKTDFVGEDIIWYVVKDANGQEGFSQVNITVTEEATSNPGETVDPDKTTVVDGQVITDPTYAGLQAYPDEVITNTNTTITIPVLMNDVGSDVTLLEPNAWSLKGGNVAMVNSQLSYMPKTDFIGEDKIWYVITDSKGQESFSVVTIDVRDPIATADVTTDTTTDVTNNGSTNSDETIETGGSTVVGQFSNVGYSNGGPKKGGKGGGGLDLLLLMLFGGLLLVKSKVFKSTKETANK